MDSGPEPVRLVILGLFGAPHGAEEAMGVRVRTWVNAVAAGRSYGKAGKRGEGAASQGERNHISGVLVKERRVARHMGPARAGLKPRLPQGPPTRAPSRR